jgi:hypothetical protein
MDARYVYVIQFNDGVVKVGQTRNIRGRYKAHQYWGRLTGREVVEIDFGLRYGSALPDERQLIAFCAARWQVLPGYRECFVDADFDELYEYFLELDRAAGARDFLPA